MTAERKMVIKMGNTYTEISNTVIMQNYDSFDIEEILECGQCFRFHKQAEKNYKIVAFNRVLHIIQENDKVIFKPCSLIEFKKIWIPYFDLERDYKKIKDSLSKSDDILNKAVCASPGIRILNQDPWECLISFIISQNNRISQIKRIINNISQKFGQKLDDEYYSFPTIDELKKATLQDLIECKAGFRAKYILDAIDKISSGTPDLVKSSSLQTADLKEILMKISGIGPKVADCILLFSFGRTEVFPTDVWIKRITENLYFDGQPTSIKKIHSFAQEKFGPYAGFAQQYLFHYARNIS